MTSRQCSVAAYHAAKNSGMLSAHRAIVYTYIWDLNYPCTAAEISAALERDGVGGPNGRSLKGNVGARVGELVRMGCVDEWQPRKCSVTGFVATTYVINGTMPRPLKQKKNITFTQCLDRLRAIRISIEQGRPMDKDAALKMLDEVIAKVDAANPV